LPRNANPAAVIMSTNAPPAAVSAICELDMPELVSAIGIAPALAVDCAGEGVPVDAASLTSSGPEA
jgi:hypothetical protein